MTYYSLIQTRRGDKLGHPSPAGAVSFKGKRGGTLMARRPKPKWGHKNGVDAPAFRFTDSDKRAIFKAIGRDDTDAQQFFLKLQDLVMISRVAVEQERNAPTAPEIREALRQTQASLTDLQKKLRRLDSVSRVLVRDGLRNSSLAEPPTIVDLLNSLETKHEQLQEALDWAVKKASDLKPPRRGPKTPGWQRHFEDNLSKSLTHLGIPPSKSRDGVFAKLLAVCLQHIQTPLRKNPSRTRTPKASFRRIKKAVDRTR